jgi:transcriptional regulator with XRE-family HTH domain
MYFSKIELLIIINFTIMQNRLQQFLDKKHLTPARFAEIMGVQRSGISHILSGRNNPSLDFIRKMIENYPELNSEWLITGKGDMFKKDVVTSIPIPDTAQKSLFEHEQKDDISKSNERYDNTKVVSHIENPLERIVIFSKSGTFKEYLPERNV